MRGPEASLQVTVQPHMLPRRTCNDRNNHPALPFEILLGEDLSCGTFICAAISCLQICRSINW